MDKTLVLKGEEVFYFHQLLFEAIKQHLSTPEECYPVVRQMILQAPLDPLQARTQYDVIMVLEIDEELILKVGLLCDLSLLGERENPLGLELFKALRKALEPIPEGGEKNEIPEPEWFKETRSRKARGSSEGSTRENP